MRRTGRLATGLLGLLLCGGPAAAQEASRGEQPTPDSVEDLSGAMQQAFEEEPTVLGRFPYLRQLLQHLPPVIRDSRIRFNARTYYFDHWRANDSRGQAWAIGGALELQSGWLFDAIRAGAAVYTSQPLVAPEDQGGTGLLRPGQQGYTVPGQAWLELRYGEDHTLKLYRQVVELPYVNKADTRMTPNTFEAYLVRGRLADLPGVQELSYVVGWIDRIRRRDQEEFVPMSRAAGVEDGDAGLATFTARLKPRENVSVGLTDHFAADTYNTFYAEASWFHQLSDDWGLRLDGQLTSQRSVGRELSAAGSFDTWNLSARAAASTGGAILTLGGSLTAKDATIQRPWGLYPGYLGLMISDFDRPGEGAALLGLSYDFKSIGVPGLSAFTNLAYGWDARLELESGEELFSSEQEIDLTIDYRFQEGLLHGLWLRVRGAWRHLEGAPRDDVQVRAIVNYEIPIL